MAPHGVVGSLPRLARRWETAASMSGIEGFFGAASMSGMEGFFGAGRIGNRADRDSTHGNAGVAARWVKTWRPNDAGDGDGGVIHCAFTVSDYFRSYSIRCKVF